MAMPKKPTASPPGYSGEEQVDNCKPQLKYTPEDIVKNLMLKANNAPNGAEALEFARAAETVCNALYVLLHLGD